MSAEVRTTAAAAGPLGTAKTMTTAGGQAAPTAKITLATTANSQQQSRAKRDVRGSNINRDVSKSIDVLLWRLNSSLDHGVGNQVTFHLLINFFNS
jgi:hypothetical protein